MKKSLVKTLLLAAVLTSVSAGNPNPVPSELYLPEEMIVELKGNGLSYDADINFLYKGKEVKTKYHVNVEWQNVFSGKFKFTKKK